MTHNNRKPVLRLTTRSGRAVTATHNHPLRVLNERGFVVWRKAGEIKPGDHLVSALFGAVEAASGDGLSEDEAVLLGYLVAEGSMKGRNAIRFTNWDPEVSAEYTALMEGLFGVTVRHYDDDQEHCVFDTKLRAVFADRYGQDYVNAAGKTVPHCVRVGGTRSSAPSCPPCTRVTAGSTPAPRSGWAAPPSSSCATCRCCSTVWVSRRPCRRASTRSTSATTGP